MKRAVFLGMVLLLAALHAEAQRKYAVLSAIGDRITVVTRNTDSDAPATAL